MVKKILGSIALLTVILMMVGTAAAINVQLSPTAIEVNSGETETMVLTVTADAGENINGFTVVGNGFTLTDKFTVDIDGNPGTSVTGPITSGTPFNINVKNDQGATNDVYPIQVVVAYDTNFGSYSYPLDATIKAVIVGIPEFPTIALPIAAILGLMFIFSIRKKD